MIQEMVNRPDWLPGNALVILYSGDVSNSEDLSFGAGAHPNFDRAAKLQITYIP